MSKIDKRKSNSKKSRNNTSANTSSTEKDCKLHGFSSSETENFRKYLLSWYDVNKRDLPWRKISAQETDRNVRGYAVWVSEVMLQQTQVATVIEYYNKWMKRWPNLQELAKATLEEVNEMWAGLGYYSRARRLHEGCVKVVNEMNGELPRDAPSLMKVLPGVGRYTAAAIASIAFNEPVGLVDGNVVRVLSRLRIIGTDCSSTVAVEMFWKLVDETVAKDRPGDFNQAIMELGATVCTPKSPQCNSCPVREICLANKQAKQFMHKKESQIKSFFDSNIQTEDCVSDVLGDIEELRSNDCQLCLPKDSTWDAELGVCNYPRKAKAKEARQERVAVCVLECHADNDIMLFLVKRPLSGLLAGLWEFPNFLVETDLSDKALVTKVKEFMMEEFEIILPESQKVSHLGEVVHLFSHVHHTYIVHKIVLTTKPEVLYGESVDGRNTKWVPESKFLEMAISTGMKKVYNLRRNNGQQKKSGGKRKREEKDGSKKQKVLDSFFVKT